MGVFWASIGPDNANAYLNINTSKLSIIPIILAFLLSWLLCIWDGPIFAKIWHYAPDTAGRYI